jgi:heme/copper-type cytochrome/quinol oxidase subunit 2
VNVLGWIIISLIIGIVLVAVVKAIAIAVIVLVTCRGDGVKGQKNPRWVHNSDTRVDRT